MTGDMNSAKTVTNIEAPLREGFLDPKRGATLGGLVGASVAVLMITVRHKWSEPKQLIGLAFFALMFSAMGRVLSLVPVRKGTLRLEMNARVLVAEATKGNGRIDLSQPFRLSRFLVMPRLPYPNGMSAVVVEQESSSVRFAWPLAFQENRELPLLPASVDAWATDRRGLSIFEHLESLTKSGSD